METDGGGWTLFTNVADPATDCADVVEAQTADAGVRDSVGNGYGTSPPGSILRQVLCCTQ